MRRYDGVERTAPIAVPLPVLPHLLLEPRVGRFLVGKLLGKLQETDARPVRPPRSRTVGYERLRDRAVRAGPVQDRNRLVVLA